MKSFNDGLDRAIEIVLFILMSGIVVFTFLGVLIRYVIRSTFGGCEEIILMQFCAVVFLGAAYGLRQKRHMAINFVYDLVPKKGRRIFDVINNLLILIFLIFLLIEGWRYTVFTKDNFTVFLGIRRSYLVSVIPIAAGLMIYYFLIQHLRYLKHRQPSNGEES